jgi:hypothetical protein
VRKKTKNGPEAMSFFLLVILNFVNKTCGWLSLARSAGRTRDGRPQRVDYGGLVVALKHRPGFVPFLTHFGPLCPLCLGLLGFGDVRH